MQKPKVLMVNKFFWRKGGAEAAFFGAIELLERMGHKVAHFSMKHDRNLASPFENYFVGPIDYDQVEGALNKMRAAKNAIYNAGARRKIERLIDEEKPDLAHLHNIHHQLSPSILFTLKSRGVPVVLTLHDFKLICPGAVLMSGGKLCELCAGNRYYNALFRRCVKGSLGASLVACIEAYANRLHRAFERAVSFFIAPSRFLKEKVIGGGYDRRKVIHLPNFVFPERYEPVFGGERKLVYCGRLSAEKGLRTLLEAVAGTSIKVNIIGEGPEERNLRESIDRFGLKNVSLKGYLSGDRLVTAISEAAAVVVPSECYENCPISVLEAFALGKPVIAARIGGIPELVAHGTDGFLFESGNASDLREAVLRALENPGLAREMGKKAREKVELRYGPDAHYEHLMEIYEMALGDSPSASPLRPAIMAKRVSQSK